MKEDVSHEKPLEFEYVKDLLIKYDQYPILFAEGQYSPEPRKSNRYTVSSIKGNSLKILIDNWISVNTCTRLIQHLSKNSNILKGSTNALYSTKVKYIWYTDNGSFYLYKNGKLYLKVNKNKELILNKLSIQKIKDRTFIDEIHCKISKSWYSRKIDFILTNGSKINIIKDKEITSIIDPAYDETDLLVDSSWLLKICNTLKTIANIKLTIDKDLQ